MFDLDGVLVDSEPLWNDAKQALVREAGGHWREDATRAMMGMSSREWSAYLRDELGVERDLEEINRDASERTCRCFRAPPKRCEPCAIVGHLAWPHRRTAS
jgi:beta-phosphoglucomutase-like phosphatase (HAD superfamily)